MRQSNITITWRGKEGQRGLTEHSLETLRRVGGKSKKNESDFITRIEKLDKEYSAVKNEKVFSFSNEIDINNKYVRVKI